MQYFKIFFLLFSLSIFTFCGDKVVQDDSKSTEENRIVPLANLSVVHAMPENGNGLLNVSSIVNVENPAGGDQVVRITGTTGEEPNVIKHQIEVHYTISFLGGINKVGHIDMITHAWGTELVNSVNGGISVCRKRCSNTLIQPDLHTLVFNQQLMNYSTNDSTLQGTVVYP